MATSEMMPLVEKWTNDFHAVQNHHGPGWMQELRLSAVAQFGAAGLPNRKTEAWKYTPVRLLEKLRPSVDHSAACAWQELNFPEPVCGASGGIVDICNGVLTENLPDTATGVTLLPLAEAVVAFEEKLQRLFTCLDIEGTQSTFAALNTAFLDQGLVIHVGENVKAGSLLIRWAFSSEKVAHLSNFRMILLLEPGAELEIIEQFESTAETANALNVVTQADLAARAVLGHVRVQHETDGVVLLTSTLVEQAAESKYCYNGFDLGGGLVRHELVTKLAGRGAEAEFNGAFILDGKRHVDNHISVDHASPGCNSTQFFRGVLGGSSRGVFNGRALIRPGADESKVQQSNANLLLSPLAEMDTKPELEIYADEVEASHGATVGQLDEDAVFYLRTRGLSDTLARRMLTTAFCHAVTDRLVDRSLAERLSGMLDAAMPGAAPVGGSPGSE
jgi:Fe-S cluster assembly protein SufD